MEQGTCPEPDGRWGAEKGKCGQDADRGSEKRPPQSTRGALSRAEKKAYYTGRSTHLMAVTACPTRAYHPVSAGSQHGYGWVRYTQACLLRPSHDRHHSL